MISQILGNEYIVSAALGGISWLAGKLWGKRKDSTLARVTTALATSSALMAQYALTMPQAPVASIITAFKGIVAIQLGKVGITERNRAPFQYLIDRAISAAVLRWVEAHGARSAIDLPITARLAKLAA
jgi:hypothetical protein